MIRRPGLAALTLCLGIAACAVPPAATDVAPITTPGQQQTIRAGQSSKADVIAALGNTRILRFDSGFEVWIYHFDDEPAAELDRLAWLESKANSWLGRPVHRVDGNAEFIVLFAPSGVVAKTRVRPKPMAP